MKEKICAPAKRVTHHKTCTRCDRKLSIDEFHKKKAGPDGHMECCRRCNTVRRYGMNSVQFDALLAKQGGVCKLCGTNKPGGGGRHGAGTFHVDHDHETGKVRGILCAVCNPLLGSMRAFADRAGVDMQRVSQQVAAYLSGKSATPW